MLGTHSELDRGQMSHISPLRVSIPEFNGKFIMAQPTMDPGYSLISLGMRISIENIIIIMAHEFAILCYQICLFYHHM